MSNSRIAELYDRYMAGRLSRQEDRELVDLLQDPAAQREWRLTATLEAKLHEDLRDSTEVASARKGIRWPIWAPLAAAAALLVTVGGILFVHRSPAAPEYAMGRLTRTTGPLTIVDADSASARITTVQTPSNSVCRLDQPDGTVIAVAGSSAMRWSQDRTSGAKTLDMTAGQAYLDVASQKQPFQIRFPSGAQAEVLGTRLLVSRTGPLDFVSVLKGNVKIQDGRTAVYVAAGQTASPGIQSGSGLFTLIQGAAMPSVLAWVDRVGVDSMRASREAPGTIATKMSMLDLSLTEIQGGVWRLNRNGDDVVAIQEDPGQRGLALFGHREWIKGKYSCKVRVLKMDQNPQPGMEPGIGLAFAYSSGGGVDMAGAASKLAPMLALSPVLNMQADFEIRAAENTLHVRRLEFWPEGHREDGWHKDDWIRTPRDTRLVKERGPCALGISTIGCSAEFFDIRLVNAVSAQATDVRASLGMIGRYDFRGLADGKVPDSSGVAPAMDLQIGKPDMVECGSDGIRVKGAVDIAARGELPKVRQGWAKNKGMSLEIIAHPKVTDVVTSGGARKLACVAAGDGSIVWVYDGGEGLTPEDRLYHFVFVLDDISGKLVQHFYQNGKPLPGVVTSPFDFGLHRRPGPIEISLVPSRNTSTITKEPWMGDLIFVGLYDRALQPDDVAALHQAGLPAAVGQAGAARGELVPWVADYYKRHNQWVLQREKFKDGPMHARLSPSNIQLTVVEGNGQVKLGRQLLKNGKEGDVLEIENRDQPYCVTELRVPGGLPDAFAVELDLLPVQTFPGPGNSAAASPFLYEGGYEKADRRSNIVNIPGLPNVSTNKESIGMVKSSGLTLTRWGQYRAEYFRVGRLETGEVLYELHLPQSPGPGIRMTWKRDDTIPMSFSGTKVRLGEIRIRRLVPPANLDGVWSWVSNYYKKHGQFIQQRENFSNGEVLGTITPAQIVAVSKVEAGQSVKLVTGAAKDGKETKLLSVENLTEKPYVSGFSIPGDLPDAFAVEFDVKPLAVLPDASKVSIDFDSHMTGTEPWEPAGLPASLAHQPLDLPPLSRGAWNTFRVEYVRIGRTPAGESIYEARFPSVQGTGIWLIRKPNNMFAISVRGAKALLSEVRVRRLLPPTNTEIVLGPPPAR